MYVNEKLHVRFISGRILTLRPMFSPSPATQERERVGERAARSRKRTTLADAEIPSSPQPSPPFHPPCSRPSRQVEEREFCLHSFGGSVRMRPFKSQPP